MMEDMTREPAVRPERLGQLMKQRGLGPGELAYLSGVAYDTIYKIAADKRPLTSGETLGKIAKALSCSVDYLLGLTDNPVPYIEEMANEIAQLGMVLGELSPWRQRELVTIAEAMARAEHADSERMHRNIEVNRRLLDMVREVGGEEELDALLDLLGHSTGFDGATVGRLLDAHETQEEKKD